jgi:hypothetical protein
MRRLIELFIILVHLRVVYTLCYSSNGTAQSSDYVPCNTSAPVSMCCNNRANCGTEARFGLCIGTNQIFREYCTDPTWQSSSCLKLCLSGHEGISAKSVNCGIRSNSENVGNQSQITACPNGSFCCGINAQDCCNANEGKFIVNDQVSDSPGVSSNAGDSSSSPKPTQTASVPETGPELRNGISKATKSSIIGISIGVGLGAMAVVAALIILWRRKKTKKMSDEAVLNESRKSFTKASFAPGYECKPELSATQTRAELDAQQQSELDSQETLPRKIVATQLRPVEMP